MLRTMPDWKLARLAAALEAAFASRQPAPDTCIHHSDRGSHASDEYRRALRKFKLIGSMSRVERCSSPQSGRVRNPRT